MSSYSPSGSDFLGGSNAAAGAGIQAGVAAGTAFIPMVGPLISGIAAIAPTRWFTPPKKLPRWLKPPSKKKKGGGSQTQLSKAVDPMVNQLTAQLSQSAGIPNASAEGAVFDVNSGTPAAGVNAKTAGSLTKLSKNTPFIIGGIVIAAAALYFITKR
jgi:hypothetical protein